MAGAGATTQTKRNDPMHGRSSEALQHLPFLSGTPVLVVAYEELEWSSRPSHHVKAGDIPALGMNSTILWGHLVAFQAPLLIVTLQNPSPVTTDLAGDSDYSCLSQHSLPPLPHLTSFTGHIEVAQWLLKSTFLLVRWTQGPDRQQHSTRLAKQMEGKCITAEST